MGDWTAAGERFRVAYGYRTRLLNVHRSIAYAAGVLRMIGWTFSWQLINPVSPSFVEVLDRSTGATVRRWNLGSEEAMPVSTMEHIVKDLTADLMLMDAETFREKYSQAGA